VAPVDGPGDLTDRELCAFQQREWRWQRVGWILLVGVVVAGLAGLLGDGPLSSTSSSSMDGAVQASFDRFLHRSDPSVVTLRISERRRDGSLQVHIGSEFLHRVRLLRITPEPESEIPGAGGINFQFASDEAGAPAEIAFRFEPKEWGSLQSDVALDDGSRVNVAQFVYP
jgi:hypothetical protein